MLLFGDWWQLKPVSGTALFSNPDDWRTGAGYHGLQLLWGDGPDSVRKCWDFKKSLRCGDPWYNAFLQQCRLGELHPDMYQQLSGFATRAPIRDMDAAHAIADPPSAAQDPCTCPAVRPAGDVRSTQWVQMFMGEGASTEEILASECPSCAAKRRSRNRILPLAGRNKAEFKQSPFDTALSLFAYNAPRQWRICFRTQRYPMRCQSQALRPAA